MPSKNFSLAHEINVDYFNPSGQWEAIDIFFLTCRGSAFKIIEKHPVLYYKIHHNNPNCQRANFPLSSHIFSLFYQFIDICQVQNLTTVCKFIANLFQITFLVQTSRPLFIIWDVWPNIYKATQLLFSIQTYSGKVFQLTARSPRQPSDGGKLCVALVGITFTCSANCRRRWEIKGKLYLNRES